ncbi:hypothetical protein E2C01_080020 [Portunus trituberculatus]|uniref:Uncharacterized protein n=1 Tax=Portunus trituberculatus TaxID=210409 RepID=A0A5B7IS17_PORTR|nr:hypothetical protein [Portunus trituberculatus]
MKLDTRFLHLHPPPQVHPSLFCSPLLLYTSPSLSLHMVLAPQSFSHPTQLPQILDLHRHLLHSPALQSCPSFSTPTNLWPVATFPVSSAHHTHTLPPPSAILTATCHKPYSEVPTNVYLYAMLHKCLSSDREN